MIKSSRPRMENTLLLFLFFLLSRISKFAHWTFIRPGAGCKRNWRIGLMCLICRQWSRGWGGKSLWLNMGLGSGWDGRIWRVGWGNFFYSTTSNLLRLQKQFFFFFPFLKFLLYAIVTRNNNQTCIENVFYFVMVKIHFFGLGRRITTYCMEQFFTK